MEPIFIKKKTFNMSVMCIFRLPPVVFLFKLSEGLIGRFQDLEYFELRMPEFHSNSMLAENNENLEKCN